MGVSVVLWQLVSLIGFHRAVLVNEWHAEYFPEISDYLKNIFRFTNW